MIKNRNGNPYILLGKMPLKAAKAIKIKPSNIYVSNSNLDHIRNKHGNELIRLGMKPLDYVKIIVREFNQIRQGTGDSFWLVIYREEYPAAAAIQINLVLKEDFIEIKTAIPMRMAEIDKKKLLWSK